MTHLQFLQLPETEFAVFQYYTGQINGLQLKAVLNVLAYRCEDALLLAEYFEDAIPETYEHDHFIASSGSFLYGLFDMDNDFAPEGAEEICATIRRKIIQDVHIFHANN